MCQSQPVYHSSPALALLEPWMQPRLPEVIDPTARQHIIQLAAGIFESHSALIANIASTSAFRANAESSNETQVRRILRDERLFLASVYYPLIKHLFAEMHPSTLYLTIDESSHGSDFNIFSLNLITDATAIPLGWILYNWEKGRIIDPDRVTVLLIGMGCALWAMWLLGREHEHIPKRKPTTTKPQSRRKSIIKQGINAFKNANKHHRSLALGTPPQPRVLDDPYRVDQLSKNDVMQ